MSEPEPPPPARLTLWLAGGGADDPGARTELFSAVYGELRAIARQQLADERRGHTLQPTALVHESWLRLLGSRQAFASTQEFLAAAANTMRRVLVDHARTRSRHKRGGGGARRLPLDAVELSTLAEPDQLLAVDEALQALEQRDPRLAEHAKLRLFAGLDERELTTALGMAERTVRRDWVLIRAFLQRHLDAG